jgi:tRNA pseudouridine13 synthase
VRLIVGQPTAGETGAVRRARELAEAGQFGEAARAWPVGFRDCAHLCRLLARTAGDARRAIFGLERRVLGFYVSAYQAWLFNRVLAERVPTLDRVLSGDLVFSHLTGAIQAVEDAETAQPSATRFEISPTGPIVGYTMSVPRGEPAAFEHRIIEEVGLSPIDLPRTGPLTCVGGRRPLRFRPEGIGCEAGSDGAGPFLELRFTLPPGCYATSLLREICKDQLAEGRVAPDDEEA